MPLDRAPIETRSRSKGRPVITGIAALPDLPSLDDQGNLTQDTINACAEVVQRASDRDLEAAVTADGDRVLELVLAGMEASYVGSPEIQADIVWSLSAGGQVWTEFVTHLSQGECSISRELPASPGVKLTMEGVTFLRMVTGGRSPMTLFATGKLKAHGDLAFAAQLTRLFRFPDKQVSRLARFRRHRAPSELSQPDGGETATADIASAPGWFGKGRK